jgi:hypothetical protein
MMNGRPGPEVERAYAVCANFCDDPHCGLHLIAERHNGDVICEVVMSPEQTLALVNLCKEHLYEKATKREA